MERKHIYTLGLMLCAIALMGAGLQTWAEVVKPQFLFGVAATVGAVLKAMYQDTPE